ncbi:MAG: L-threonine 3-dehydrogenase [Wenzhouxiangellaceae bacterium]
MTATMRALVKSEAAAGIQLQQVPVPEPGPNEVLVQVEKTAICGTDLHIYQWDDWSQRTIQRPLVIGHEFVGRISRLGSAVQGYEVGQRVSAEGHIVCGICRNCRAGKPHLCPDTVGIGVNRDGAFAEYVVVPTTNLWPIPEGIAPELAAFFDPFGNAAHCALQFDLVGEDVLITGAGPIGIIAAGICKHVGARHVVVTDVNDYRLELARQMGATRLVNVRNEPVSEVLRELHIDGFDIGLEMSGNPQAFASLIDSMYHGGKVALLGLLPRNTSVDWDKVIFKGLELHGIYGRRMYETWYKMTQMVLTGFPLHKAMTHHIPIDQYEEGFALMASGQCGKVVCDWTGEVRPLATAG